MEAKSREMLSSGAEAHLTLRRYVGAISPHLLRKEQTEQERFIARMKRETMGRRSSLRRTILSQE